MFRGQNDLEKQQTNKTSKKRLSSDQVNLLERTFTTNKKLEPELKQQLANQLGVPPRQVAIWYQNKRARWRTQSLEFDYNAIQIKLDNVLLENKRLKNEVMHLQQELTNAQNMLYGLNYQGVGTSLTQPSSSLSQPQPPQQPSVPYSRVVNGSACNSSCDEGSSSLNEDTNRDHEVLQLQVDELYACLMGDKF